MRQAGVTLAGVVCHTPTGAARVRATLPDVRIVEGSEVIPATRGVLLAVPDSQITPCAADLEGRLTTAPALALHTSGLLGGDALEPLEALGTHLGSLHPLMTFASATGPLVRLDGALAVVEGDAEAVHAARLLARRLGLRPVALAAGQKPRYHAAAALAANLCHVLVAVAREELVAVGLSSDQANAALRPLLEATLADVLQSHGLEKLTGPLVRADAATVAAHLSALPHDVAAAYRSVAALAVARLEAASALSTHATQALHDALTSPAQCDSVTKMRQSGSI
jgi:predicted short-subunit dehydrogenase-like oxidoreductase (DUF2520 family)